MCAPYRRVGIAAAVTCLAAGVYLWFRLPTSTPIASTDQPSVADNYSNIHQSDYVGPQSCQNCHAKQYDEWHRHPHRRMNQNASDETVVGDFSNRRVNYANGSVLFEVRGPHYFMSLFQRERKIREYRVTRTVGSRFTQMYIGIQTEGPEPKNDPVYSVEGKLPFGYWMKRDCWTPEFYFDVDLEKDTSSDEIKFQRLRCSQRDLLWGQNCIYCHNTYAYEQRVALGAGLGFPDEDVLVSATPQMISAWGQLSPEKLVTVGISCESCHFGCREHVQSGKPTRYVPSSPHLKVSPEKFKSRGGDPSSAYTLNSICAQCHRAEVLRYPDGAAAINSREALDLIQGACANQIKCNDCHSVHQGSAEGGLFTLSEIQSKCVSCHTSLGDADQLTGHTRHSSEANVSCLDCHMPKIVQGLDSVVRSHYIQAPVTSRMLTGGGPNACNLCHLDRSIRWTLDALEKGWGRQMDPGSESHFYGERGEKPVGDVWLNHEKPLVRLTAVEAWSRSILAQKKLPELLNVLNDDHPLNRMFGLFAVERVLGRRLSDAEFDPLATPARRSQQVQSLVLQYSGK